MATVETKSKPTPAYAAFTTNKSFLESLKTNGIPSRVDRTVMKSLPGGVQGQVLTGLRFFDLIDDKGKPAPPLKALVDTVGTEEWPAALKEHIYPAYEEIIGDLDLMTATPGQLTECFRENTSATGATLDKGLRFFLQLLKEAKIEHGPHLADMKVKTSYKKSPKPKAAEAVAEKRADESLEDDEVDVLVKWSIPFVGKKNGYIAFPKDIVTADCATISAIVEAIKAYAKQNDEF